MHCAASGQRFVAGFHDARNNGKVPINSVAVPGAGRNTPLSLPPLPPKRRQVAAERLVSCRAQREAVGQQVQRQVEGSREDEQLQMWMDRLASKKPTARTLALLQLLRIEQEGAFAGLVGGSPGADTDETDGGLDGSSDADGGSSREADGRGGAAGGRQQQQQGNRSWSARLDPRQARLVTELVGGVTRWRRRLDYTLTQLLRGRDLGQLDPPLRQALRLGLYELTELKNSHHGVTDSYVELMKAVVHQGAANVANGTLRTVARLLESGQLPLPPPPAKGMAPEQLAEVLAVGASHPTWMVQRWLVQYGPAGTLGLLRHNNLRPRYALRLAPGVNAEAFCRRLADGGVQAQPSRFLPSEFVTLDRGLQALLAGGLVQRGDAQVQDEAAGLVVAYLDPQPGDTILDACAAPGGKTLFAAGRMRGQGVITALDVSRTRLAALRRAAEKQRHGRIVRTHAADLRRFAAKRWLPQGPPPEAAAEGEGEETGDEEAPSEAALEAEAVAESSSGNLPAQGGSDSSDAGGDSSSAQRQPWQYDRVLLDAPCSGTGVLAKRADMRWRRTLSELRQLAALQAELLDAAAELVVPGGLLVYSTCSIEQEENQLQVAAFLQRHPGYVVEAPPPTAGVPQQCITAEGYLCMLPHVHGTDGAFAARLRRLGPSSSSSSGSGGSGEEAEQGQGGSGSGESEELSGSSGVSAEAD